MKSIILFDGYCGLCSRTIDFIRKYDTKEQYSLLALQSQEAEPYIQQYNLKTDNFDSVVLIEDNQVFIKSTAALKVVKNLNGTIRYLYFFIYLPTPMRDFIYGCIAKNRYLLFKERQSCKTNYFLKD